MKGMYKICVICRSRILQGIHLRRHLHLNLGRKREPPSGAATPPHTVGSLDPGFANPLYDSSPFEKNVSKQRKQKTDKMILSFVGTLQHECGSPIPMMNP